MSLSDIDERRVKEIVMAEVARQIQPLHDWQLAFWSNGSGRPPGYFQMRVQADDERYERISEALKPVVDFVNTSNTRQKEQEDRQREREKKIKFWLPIINGVGVTLLGGIVTLFGFAYREAAPVVKALIEDYMKSHPMVIENMRNVSPSDPVPAYSGGQKRNDKAKAGG